MRISDWSSDVCSSDLRRFWRQAMSGERAGDADLAHAFGLLKSTEAIADTLDRARHYGQRAIDALGSFAPSAARAALIETAEFAVARTYCPRFRSKPPFPDRKRTRLNSRH